MTIVQRFQKKTNYNTFYLLKSQLLDQNISKKKSQILNNVKSEYSDKLIKKQREIQFYEQKIKENEIIFNDLLKSCEISGKIIQEKEKTIENLNQGSKIKKINTMLEKIEGIENQVIIIDLFYSTIVFLFCFSWNQLRISIQC